MRDLAAECLYMVEEKWVQEYHATKTVSVPTRSMRHLTIMFGAFGTKRCLHLNDYETTTCSLTWNKIWPVWAKGILNPAILNPVLGSLDQASPPLALNFILLHKLLWGNSRGWLSLLFNPINHALQWASYCVVLLAFSQYPIFSTTTVSFKLQWYDIIISL